jgi:hypothetical protein
MYSKMFGPIVNWLLSYIYDFITLKRRERTLKALRDELKIYKEMDSLVDEENVDRVMFISLHNGGGRIIPGKAKYISIIEEAKSSKITSCVEKHQKKLVDIEYMERMIQPIFSPTNMTKIITNELNSGLIKELYVSEGIKEVIIVYMAFNQDYIWYLTINSHTHINEKDEDLLKKIHSARNVIANVLEDYYQLEGR